MRITDSTAREKLIAYINELEKENQRLEERIVDKNSEIKSLRMAPEQRERLVQAADLMADKGIIHNTPACKYAWINGI
jgi:Mg2+ and Co2+ transporter CorA